MSLAAAAGPSAFDLHLDEDEVRLLEDTERLARERLAPLETDHGSSGVNRPLIAAMADGGLLARLFAAGEDGAAPQVSALSLCLIREGLARASTEAETAFALQGLGAFPILEAGSRVIRSEWIGKVAAGEAVPAFALSEPEAGSDVASISLRAEREADGFRLNGEKTWISNAPEADIYSVFARTTEGAGARGLTAFAVLGTARGLSGEGIEMISPHPIGRLCFDDVLVPDSHVLGEVDGGFRVAMRTLDLFRPSVGAFAVGMAQAALDIAVGHARSRRAFGAALSSFQGVAHPLAEMATRVQASRLLVHQAARAYDDGAQPVSQIAAMAKLMATEVAQQAVDTAVQIGGAQALRRGHRLEHLYRDVRAPRIYEGASEIQREIIARAMLGPPR